MAVATITHKRGVMDVEVNDALPLSKEDVTMIISMIYYYAEGRETLIRIKAKNAPFWAVCALVAAAVETAPAVAVYEDGSFVIVYSRSPLFHVGQRIEL